ncbi:Aldo/keto reductase [Coniochaeta ligniaria NRRL 30616]|uniref:GCS light chain n=1 Tax=Coniochaeta ligniaria NRRL 30616 TaxID=1408157 RepID=A0A1J7IN81_9PEZI|nr:Aldo/keto reductase [Coniochaeta ligniaria NRRL 30616]
MTKSIILSTGNIVSGGPSIFRKAGASRSNRELINSLKSNFEAAKEEYATLPVDGANGHTNGNGPAPNHAPLSVWTEQQDDVLYVPRINWDFAGLQEEPSQYDVTVKLFFLTSGSVSPPSAREQHARQALALVLKELRIPKVDLLVVSFPGMSFDGDCEWEADKQNAQQGEDEEEAASWPALERLQKEGLVKNLGIAEFGSEKLARLLKRVEVKPTVDQINIKNCCNVPPPLVKLAKEQGIDLLVHNDSTDVLPKGTLRELLGPEPRGAGVLADGGVCSGLKGDLTPQWVIKYTAVVRDRGVIENKGYFAGAELEEA